MYYRISGLSPESFRQFIDLDDDALKTRGIRRVVADKHPGFPCRVSLQDAEPGETLLLLSFEHHVVDGPYRASGPIFVREAAQAGVFHNTIPEQQRSRLLSVRAYDAEGWMHDAEVVEGVELQALIERFFANVSVAYLHVHNARRGCYACRVDRV